MSMRPLIDHALCQRIAEVFRRHDYTERNVVSTLGAATASVLSFARLGPMMQRTAAGRPLDTLIRLFVIGNRVDEVTLAAIVAPTDRRARSAMASLHGKPISLMALGLMEPSLIDWM